MEYMTRREMLLSLFREWLKAQGYKKNTWDAIVKAVRRIQREAGKTYITLEDTERLISKITVGKWYRAKLRQATRRWLEFMEWWGQKRTQEEFKEFLRGKGYSKYTVRNYLDVIKMASGGRKGTKSERKKINAALRAFGDFVRQSYRKG